MTTRVVRKRYQKGDVSNERQAILSRLATVSKTLDELIVKDMVQSANLDHDLRMAMWLVDNVRDRFPSFRENSAPHGSRN